MRVTECRYTNMFGFAAETLYFTREVWVLIKYKLNMVILSTFDKSDSTSRIKLLNVSQHVMNTSMLSMWSQTKLYKNQDIFIFKV